MSWKDLFVNGEGNPTSETKKEEPKQETTKFPNVGSVTNTISNVFNFPTQTQQTPTFTGAQVSTEHLEKAQEIYQKGFDSLNQNGYDFYEFYQAVVHGGVDNPQIYSMAYAMGYGMDKTISKDKLLQQADFYLNEIRKVYTDNVSKGEGKKQSLLAQKNSENQALSNELELMRQQMEALKLQIQDRENKLSAIDGKYLSEWGLNEHRKKYSCELSGGQRQRTAIIEQILSYKHFMIFDEPFSGLDVGNIEKVKESFVRIQNDNEYNTIIFSTHDIKLAIELADSIYIIGFPEGNTEYSTIVKHYDLKAMGLAWTEYNDNHRAVFNEIKELLLRS